jgi:hypothetical protein
MRYVTPLSLRRKQIQIPQEWSDWNQGESLEIRDGQTCTTDGFTHRFRTLCNHPSVSFQLARELCQDLAKHPDSQNHGTQYGSPLLRNWGHSNTCKTENFKIIIMRYIFYLYIVYLPMS